MNCNSTLWGVYFGIGDQNSIQALKAAYCIVGFWFVAAFIGGAMDLFGQPDVRF